MTRTDRTLGSNEPGLSRASAWKVIIFSVVALVLGVLLAGTWVAKWSGVILIPVSFALAMVSFVLSGSSQGRSSYRELAPRTWKEWTGVLLALAGVVIGVASLVAE